MAKPTKPAHAPVCQAILAQFIADLTEAGEASDLVERLRKTILTEGKLTEPALRKAMFPDE